MALLLKRIAEGYFYLMDEVSDPRANAFFLMSSPLPVLTILTLWLFFIYKWGPEFMKNREPFNLKKIMIVYNIFQVLCNVYILSWILRGIGQVNLRCTEVDYSESYWGLTFLNFTYWYFLLKVLDLVDTVFFVLRKKFNHMSFLHVYHHGGMIIIAWIGVKFVGGGHAYFIGLLNCIVHTILYLYYLLTAYDSKYSRLLWLKKLITQAQLIQFGFLLFTFGQILLIPDCTFPKIVVFFFIPQNLFMLILFGDFYVRTYILGPRRRKRELEEKMRQPKEESNNVHIQEANK